MQPKKLRVPGIVLHKASGRGVVFLRGPDGKRTMVYLRGEHDSAEEQRHYREVLAAYLAGKPVVARPAPRASEWPTVAQLCASFLLHAQRYYVDDKGNISSSVEAFALAFAPLLDLFRDLATDQLSIVALQQARQVLVDSGSHCRNTINTR